MENFDRNKDKDLATILTWILKNFELSQIERLIRRLQDFVEYMKERN